MVGSLFARTKFAICPRCERTMAPGASCDESAWAGGIAPTRFGAERSPGDRPTCRDCNTPRGGTHHYGCCDEECPHGEQAIMCDACPVLEHDPYFDKIGRVALGA